MLHDGALNVGKAIQQTMHKLTFKGCGLLFSLKKQKLHICVRFYAPTNEWIKQYGLSVIEPSTGTFFFLTRHSTCVCVAIEYGQRSIQVVARARHQEQNNNIVLFVFFPIYIFSSMCVYGSKTSQVIMYSVMYYRRGATDDWRESNTYTHTIQTMG